VSVREIVMRILHPGRSPDCAVQKSETPLPNQEEAEAVRQGWREAIHKNRNNLTASVQIARRIQRASQTMLDAATEMANEIQKSRERLH
jgi:hypothetical protein